MIMEVIQIGLMLLLCSMCRGARILGVIPTPSYSHQVIYQPLWKELSLRGHQVTVLTTNLINDRSLTNLTEIDLSFSYKYLEENLAEIINSSSNGFLKRMRLSQQSFANVIDAQLGHNQVQMLISDPSQHFDLLIVEYYHIAALYLSTKFNCPYIGVSSTDLPNLFYHEMGSVGHPILYPLQMIEIHDNNIFQRVQLILLEIFVNTVIDLYSAHETIARKHFQDVIPARTLLQRASLVFVNTDPIFHYVRPLLPSFIPIGGKLVRIPVKPLQDNVKKFLDEADEGFIYFSLGSNVKCKDIPESTLNVILETFRRLPYKVLWKCEFDEMANKPDNVMILKWVSQMDVLKHSNLKLFITHGGAQSMEEAIFARVPMVGMPFFADQHSNVYKMVKLGFAVSLDYKRLSKTMFQDAIFEVISNNRYRNRIRHLADLVEDQPMTGLERAVWWTEYVLRHKGASHFRSPALDIPWYQYYLLDVIGVLSIAFMILVWLVYYLMKCVLKVLHRFMTKIKQKRS